MRKAFTARQNHPQATILPTHVQPVIIVLKALTMKSIARKASFQPIQATRTLMLAKFATLGNSVEVTETQLATLAVLDSFVILDQIQKTQFVL